MTDIQWKLKEFKISELTDYYKNPRQLTEAQYKQLKTSLDKFGLIDKPIVNIDPNHTVIGGHQRLNVLRRENTKTVECWIPDRELDEREIEELNIRLNKNTGEWDFDVLANAFETEDLLEWGFSEMELGISDLDLPDGDPDSENIYSKKIDIPIYEKQRDVPPEINLLYQIEKYSQLLAEIEQSNVSKTEKAFLTLAASRHIIFDYGEIAEYYAHATPEMQEQMEKSALVIIDFNSAVKDGYIKLRSGIEQIFNEDHEADEE